MHRNKSVDLHSFSMVPKTHVPRSTFSRQTTHKTTFDSGWLIPVICDEILPGDAMRLSMTGFTRLATPIFPIMDNLYLDSFFFFIPCRLLWDKWQRFQGEQLNPGDSISFSIPQIVSIAGGYAPNSLYDYFGLPTFGQVGAGNSVSHSALPLRAYNLVYQEWFKSQDLITAPPLNRGDGPDLAADYQLLRRGKRHDYFTSCLPAPQKGQAVTMPLGTTAPVITTGVTPQINAGGTPRNLLVSQLSSTAMLGYSGALVGASNATWANPTGLQVDLSAATAATINQMRQAFQTQKVLERDARSGTRYVEQLRARWGVAPPDFRLQRPEYLGGGSTRINIQPIAQTSGSPGAGAYTPTPQGNLAAIGHGVAAGHGFSASFTEHGYVLGLVNVRADMTYQQGLRKMWSRLTRYDFYMPEFAMLGEQAVLNKEIYCDGSANDNNVFGYQEHWSELRHFPSQVTGLFRSTTSGTLDGWHLAQRFQGLPTLNKTFIEETPPVQRIVAVGAAAQGKEFIFDSFFDIRHTRPMPVFSVPGMIDHF